jgi:aryl-alcohol dehydrogenase-like predicted oxidoreductase
MTYGHLGRFTPWEEIWQAIEQLVRKGKISSSALIWPARSTGARFSTSSSPGSRPPPATKL